MTIKVSIIAFVIATAVLLSCSNGEEEAGSESTTQQVEAVNQAALEEMALTGLEKQLVDTLLGIWNDPSNISSLTQAAAMIGEEVSDSVRMELIAKLGDHRDLCKRLQLYGPYTVALTNDEKRIGLYIVRYQKENQEFPPLDSIVSRTGLPEEEVRDRLEFFADIGFLFDLGGPDANNALGYSYGDHMADVIDNTGLHYHTFYVGDRLPFNVCCAKEAFYKLLAQYPDAEVRYETIDPLTVEPIIVQFEAGEITEVSPPEAQFLEGGFCVSNCLFRTRENATNYVSGLPFVQRHQIYSVQERLERLKQDIEQAQQSGE